MDRKATCDFADIAPGTYALAVIHDENRDGELATNWMVMPQEGYGNGAGVACADGPQDSLSKWTVTW